jgi:hypothetical protein
VKGEQELHPRTPELAHLVEMVRHEGMSLDWLILGIGPERQGTLIPRVELADALRAHLVAEISKLVPQRESALVDRVVAPAAELLREVVETYRVRIQDRLRDRRRERRAMNYGKDWGARGIELLESFFDQEPGGAPTGERPPFRPGPVLRYEAEDVPDARED